MLYHLMHSISGSLMCSTIVMPADYEMLVSHSPPVYNHSYLSNYPPSHFRYGHDSCSTVPRSFCRNSSTDSLVNFTTSKPPSLKMPALPKRPCLVIRPYDSSSHSSVEEDPTSPTKLKKKVVFADDRGMSLTQVRVMTEPSNVPPVWNFRFLAQVTNGISSDPKSSDEPWEITFSQPASDYIAFRKKLETNKVSLENVIVKNVDEVLLGTVKVSNLAFEKEVFVRSSSDQWKTYEDSFCTFVPNSCTGSSSGAYVIYDTFSFKLTLPPKSRCLEFCVCFRCNGVERWDNNGGQNYVLLKKVQTKLHKSFNHDDLNNDKNPILDKISRNGTKYTDAVQMKIDSWSEFASWNHLDNSSPYW